MVLHLEVSSMPRSLMGRGHFKRFTCTGGAAGLVLTSLLNVSFAAAQTAAPPPTPTSPSSASPPAVNPPAVNPPVRPAPAPAPSPAAATPTGETPQSSSTGADTANSTSLESVTPQPAPPSAEQLAQAQAALEQGHTAYAGGDYVTAEAHFRQALALVPSAQAQYGLAMALDLQGKPTEAFVALEELFQMVDHAQLPQEQLAAATQRHAVLKTIPATVVVQVNGSGADSAAAGSVQGATLAVDGVPQAGMSPFTLKLTAGDHEVKVEAPGYEPTIVQLSVRPAESLERSVALNAIPEPAPVQPPPAPVAERPPFPPPAASKTPAFVTIGVAGAAAVVGTVFGVQALSAKDKFESNPTIAHADDVERNALIADMAFGIAFTLGVTGVVLLLADEPPADTSAAATDMDTALQVFPFVSGDAGGAAARFVF